MKHLILLRIYGEPIITARREGDQILFSSKFYDVNNQLRLSVVDNFWESDTDLSDVRYSEGKDDTDFWLSIKMKDSEPYLDFKIINDELHIVGKFYRNGNLLDVREDGVFHTDGRQAFSMTNSKISHSGVGIDIT